MPSRTTETPDEWSSSADIISRFLALQQIYSATELDAYLQSQRSIDTDTSDSATQPIDVVVLCASAILAIPEAVFEWAVQDQARPDARLRNTVLVLCGGIKPGTSFVYDAIKSSKKYSQVYDDINGKPEGQVLKTMAERFYKLDISKSEHQHLSEAGFRILISDRSTNCGADAVETRKVLEGNGIHSPRSIVVVQDPAMSSRTVSSFSKVYDDQEAHISSWPRLKSGSLPRQGKGQEKNMQRELWSMDRFLDRIMGDTSHVQLKNIKANSSIVIPGEVEDAWSTIMHKDSLKSSD
ncbi:Ff.00g067970.m01.CDS01 [Fusarium sp. VM40]|nr:Ff.00g067970.m01.CDS01 [Fusarium sp. VM40]